MDAGAVNSTFQRFLTFKQNSKRCIDKIVGNCLGTWLGLMHERTCVGAHVRLFALGLGYKLSLTYIFRV